MRAAGRQDTAVSPARTAVAGERAPARTAALVLALLACLLSGCRRTSAEWIEELKGTDPWSRRMAVLALRSVPDADCELAFRALAIRLKDRDVEVARAIEDSLRLLAHRRPDLPAKALPAFPAERMGHRQFMARLLLELERDGYPEVDAAPDPTLDGELQSGPTSASRRCARCYRTSARIHRARSAFIARASPPRRSALPRALQCVSRSA
jgi:hypothetical protein